MPSDRFPYDKPSREALVMLLQETKPTWNVTLHNVRFNEFVFAPTDTKQGRTFIDVVFINQGITAPFCYRRLDIGRAVGASIDITVSGEITSTKIVNEINRLRDMRFGNIDVYMNDRVLAPEGGSLTYRIRARAESPVWYGETIVRVESERPPVPQRVRLLEQDGGSATPPMMRLLEDGQPRLLEEGT